MTKCLSFALALLVAPVLLIGLLCLTQQPRAQLTMTGVGGGGVGGASYTGPGDCSGCVTSAFAWGGLRAFSAAKRGSNAVNACNSTGGGDVCVNLVTDAVTGALVAQSVNGGTCPGTNCTVHTIYDQSGNTNCSGPAACDWVQATVANRPTLDANCIGSLPCMTFGSPKRLLAGIIAAQAQPFTVSLVVNMNAADNFVSAFVSGAEVDALTPNTTRIFAGASLAVTVAAGTFHGVQSVFNGASSDVNVNGTSNTGAAGSGSLTVNSNLSLGDTVFAGKMIEVGIFLSAFSTAQSVAENTNQQGYWKY
jgi:hypothetical protein